MNAVISHSVRWGRHDPDVREKLREYENGLVFGRQARSLIFEELSRGACNIPTVQSLLLLSAAECSAGNSTQAWVYSGTAFRLIDHLGICIDVERYASSAQLSDEDIEIRHRLYWSSYFWDKIISLYLGRSPYLQHTTVSPPRIMCKCIAFLMLLMDQLKPGERTARLTLCKWTTLARKSHGYRTELRFPMVRRTRQRHLIRRLAS